MTRSRAVRPCPKSCANCCAIPHGEAVNVDTDSTILAVIQRIPFRGPSAARLVGHRLFLATTEAPILGD